MRTLIFSILMMAVTVLNLNSQDLKIHKTDGSIITVPLNTIDSITFVESGGAFVCGTSTVTDANGNIYNTVQIGDQCWMKESLKVGTMVNGSVEHTNNGIIEKYCYDNNPVNCDVYGGLYQWNEMMKYATTAGVQGICPDGWQLATDAEWTSLTTFLGGESVAGGKMKETGTTHWNSPNTGATNSSGFTALPGGYRHHNGTFGTIGFTGVFWSSTEYSPTNAWSRTLYNNGENVYRANDTNKGFGFSVRCLRD